MNLLYKLYKNHTNIKVFLILATNKNARLRYEALDKCLSNFSRKFYIEDLQQAVCQFLKDQLSEEITVSVRQIYQDLKEMEINPVMNAPIKAYKDGSRRKYYRYSEPGFSIVDLTDDELTQLETTVRMLASFRGMPQFDWMADIINKLKKKYKVKGSEKTVISFDSNIDLVGIDLFRELFSFIVKEQPVKLTYQPYEQAEDPCVFHPYFLKQYNNRWYLLGYNEKYKDISIYAIDRIKYVEPCDKDIQFIPDSIIGDPMDYFYDIIGITIPKEAKIEKVVLRFSPKRFRYVVSKPLHNSQTHNHAEHTVTLKIMPNRELTQTILSFGKDVEILEPQHLREEIASIYKEAFEKNSVLKFGCKTEQ